jgi:predicted phage replisome organizer
MAEEKRFYWLKLRRDFFKRHDVSIIEDMDNGKDYLIFYLKLLCESIDHDGNLRFSNEIPYTDKMLASVTKTNVDIVRSALKIFTELDMIEVREDKTIYMTELPKMLGSEVASAERVRAFRARQKEKEALLGNANVTPAKQLVTQEKELDKDIEKELSKKEYIKNNIYINHAREEETYESIMNDFEVSPSVRPMVWNFIKHCQLNGRTLTNDKLSGILFEMDKQRLDDDEKVKTLQAAINGGYFDIKRN